MRKLTINNFISVDGVVQGPSYPDEDTSGGFERGGWNAPYPRRDLDAVAGLGRRTYEIFAAHWPNAGEEEQALAEPMNRLPKYVASTTLSEPLAWQNATLLPGNVAEAVAALKQDDGGDLRVIGSSQLAQTLIEHDLVDEFRLMITRSSSAPEAPVRRRRQTENAATRRDRDDKHGRDPRHIRARRRHLNRTRAAGGMERLWSRAVAIGGNRWQMGRRRKRLKQAKTVAVGCDRLPPGPYGKEGVDGSSP